MSSEAEPIFVAGDRVRVSEAYDWAQGALGTVSRVPQAVADLTGDWQHASRFVKTLRGMVQFYWVWFDEGQVDTDGDGPYRGAEVEAAYLIPQGRE